MWSSLDWLYPPSCVSCGQRGHRFCQDCLKKVLPLQMPLCTVCGVPMVSTGKCIQCRNSRPQFHLLRSWAVFDGSIRKAIHQLKYKRDISLGVVLAGFMASYIKGMNWPIDIVIPVPLARKRKNERGYNQASLIAFPLSLQLRWKYVSGGLARIRETESQVGLNSTDRQENVINAFRAVRKYVEGKNILLVDDVATTGATLSSCAQALHTGGAKTVYALTVARPLASRGQSVS
jgi:competence protein ComFC